MKALIQNFKTINRAAFCLFIFTAYYSYKPYLNRQRDSSLQLKEKIAVGKKYEFKLVSGQTLLMKVDTVGDDRVKGDAVLKGGGRINNYIVLFDQVESIKEGKISIGWTLFAIAVPVTVLVIIFSNMTYDLGGGI